MGWSRGSDLMADIIDAIQVNVPNKAVRKQIYLQIIPAFEELDCDELQECMNLDAAFDKALLEHDPYLEETLKELASDG